ncbi:hypothetical protein P171DRAFT_468711, partial [Karstenula rhodostoma CBS 690.94]
MASPLQHVFSHHHVHLTSPCPPHIMTSHCRYAPHSGPELRATSGISAVDGTSLQGRLQSFERKSGWHRTEAHHEVSSGHQADLLLRARVDKVNWNTATSVQLGGRPRSNKPAPAKVVVEAALCPALLESGQRQNSPLVKEEDRMQCLLPRLARSFSFFRSGSREP